MADLQARHAYRAYLHSETLRVIAPYLVLAAVTLTMMILIAATRFPASLAAEEDRGPGSHRAIALLRRPHFVMAVVAQFAYVGAQVGTWSYLIRYIQTYTGESEKVAGYCLTGSLVLFGAARFFSAWLMRFVHPNRLMAIYAIVSTVLDAIGVLFPGWAGMIALLLTSFFMSLMFPTIFAQGIRGLSETARLGGSLIVMAIVGGAVLTPAMGLLSVRFGGLAIAYLVPALAYVLVALYSFADVRLAGPGATVTG